MRSKIFSMCFSALLFSAVGALHASNFGEEEVELRLGEVYDLKSGTETCPISFDFTEATKTVHLLDHGNVHSCIKTLINGVYDANKVDLMPDGWAVVSSKDYQIPFMGRHDVKDKMDRVQYVTYTFITKDRKMVVAYVNIHEKKGALTKAAR